MVIISVYVLGIAYLHQAVFQGYLAFTPVIHSLLGFVISLLLVFRTNTAYERWWEARRFWGQLTNVSRNIALKLDAVLPGAHASRALLSSHLTRFPRALAHHLRDLPYETGSTIQHAPSAVTAAIYRELSSLRRRGELGLEDILFLDAALSQLPEICGGCERIKKTPIPYSYHLFIKKFIFAYIVSLPFLFVSEFGYWTALFATFLFYVLGSLEILAEEVENPFGTDANDLPLDDFSVTIRVASRRSFFPATAPEESSCGQGLRRSERVMAGPYSNRSLR